MFHQKIVSFLRYVCEGHSINHSKFFGGQKMWQCRKWSFHFFGKSKIAVITYRVILICLDSLCFYNVMLDNDLLCYLFSVKPVILV
jgi:hypothetical protein